jgi:hypothetical protein
MDTSGLYEIPSGPLSLKRAFNVTVTLDGSFSEEGHRDRDCGNDDRSGC